MIYLFIYLLQHRLFVVVVVAAAAAAGFLILPRPPLRLDLVNKRCQFQVPTADPTFSRSGTGCFTQIRVLLIVCKFCVKLVTRLCV